MRNHYMAIYLVLKAMALQLSFANNGKIDKLSGHENSILKLFAIFFPLLHHINTTIHHFYSRASLLLTFGEFMNLSQCFAHYKEIVIMQGV